MFDFSGIFGVERFKIWCQKVLPTVYDDSLSYMELLCKVLKVLEEYGKGSAEIAEQVVLLKEELSKLDADTDESVGEIDKAIETLTNSVDAIDKDVNDILSGVKSVGNADRVKTFDFRRFNGQSDGVVFGKCISGVEKDQLCVIAVFGQTLSPCIYGINGSGSIYQIAGDSEFDWIDSGTVIEGENYDLYYLYRCLPRRNKFPIITILSCTDDWYFYDGTFNGTFSTNPVTRYNVQLGKTYLTKEQIDAIVMCGDIFNGLSTAQMTNLKTFAVGETRKANTVTETDTASIPIYIPSGVYVLSIYMRGEYSGDGNAFTGVLDSTDTQIYDGNGMLRGCLAVTSSGSVTYAYNPYSEGDTPTVGIFGVNNILTDEPVNVYLTVRRIY